MKKSSFLINRILSFVIMYICFAFNVSFSQQFVIKIQLQQPPPGQLNLHHLWKAKLTNTSGKDLKLYLEGYAEEEKEGKIVDGQTKIFSMPPGERSYQYEDFKTGDVKWYPKKTDYKTIIERTGIAPEGTYTICMVAKNESGDIIGMENCIVQPILPPMASEINLISPDNDASISELNPLFIWSPPMPAPVTRNHYDLKIVELRKGQSLQDAIKNNFVFFEEKGIKPTQFQYTTKGPQFKVGVKYAWMIKSGEITSEVWEFSIAFSDSTYLPIKNREYTSGLKYFYNLNTTPQIDFVEIFKDTLYLQINHSYSSTNELLIKIYDIESKTILKSKTGSNMVDKNLNGLNLFSLVLKHYPIKPLKKYFLKISDYKSNYYLNFIIKKKI